MLSHNKEKNKSDYFSGRKCFQEFMVCIAEQDKHDADELSGCRSKRQRF